jgi:TPR repeat protein
MSSSANAMNYLQKKESGDLCTSDENYFLIKEDKQTIELLAHVSKSLCPSAQNSLGWCYEHGLGIKKNEIRAKQLYQEAAHKGCLFALFNLGYCYEYGIGIEKNNHHAKKLYKKFTKQVLRSKNNAR